MGAVPGRTIQVKRRLYEPHVRREAGRGRRRRFPFALVLLPLLLMISSTGVPGARAEEPVPIEPGDEIRLTLAGTEPEVLTGRLWAVESGRLVLIPYDGGERRNVESERVVAVEALRPGRRHAGEGFLIGMAAGVVTAALADYSDGPDSDFDDGFDEVAMVLLGGVGACVGALLGYTVQSHDWEAARLARTPPGRGVAGGADAAVASWAPRPAALALSVGFTREF